MFLSDKDISLEDEHEVYDLMDEEDREDDVFFEDGIELDLDLEDEYDEIADEYDKLVDNIDSDESLPEYEDVNDYDDDD